MRSTQSGVLLTALTLLILVLTGSAAPQKNLSLDQILERAYQREVAFKELLKDYICQVTAITREPQKDGPAKTLSIVEKTVYRQLPDKRVEKYNAITEEGKVLSPEKVAEYQKKEKKTMSMRGSFLDPEERPNYTYELMPPDTIRGIPSYVLRIKPKKKSKDLIDGKVWLHQENFEVVKLDFQPAKNPKYVKEIHMIIDFNEVQPGFWLLTELKIDARAGFLFFKKHFHHHETWHDYQINVDLPDSIFVEEE